MLNMNTKKPTGTTCPTLAHAEMRAMPSSAGYPSAEQAGRSHVLVDDGGLDVGDLGP